MKHQQHVLYIVSPTVNHVAKACRRGIHHFFMRTSSIWQTIIQNCFERFIENEKAFWSRTLERVANTSSMSIDVAVRLIFLHVYSYFQLLKTVRLHCHVSLVSRFFSVIVSLFGLRFFFAHVKIVKNLATLDKNETKKRKEKK